MFSGISFVLSHHVLWIYCLLVLLYIAELHIHKKIHIYLMDCKGDMTNEGEITMAYIEIRKRRVLFLCLLSSRPGLSTGYSSAS